jgi:hypothetical protein
MPKGMPTMARQLPSYPADGRRRADVNAMLSRLRRHRPFYIEVNGGQHFVQSHGYCPALAVYVQNYIPGLKSEEETKKP